MTYIVCCDHPFYPKVEYCDTAELASGIAAEFQRDMAVADGEKRCTITIAEVISTVTVPSGSYTDFFEACCARKSAENRYHTLPGA